MFPEGLGVAAALVLPSLCCLLGPKGQRTLYPPGWRLLDVSASTLSINVGTRKIVNYAWPG